jgi:uncharacterized membrane protein
MIIIHKGWGILAVLIPVGFFCAGMLMPKFNDPKINAHLLEATILMSALAVWLVGRKLNGSTEEATVIVSGRDEAPSSKVKNQHTLYWIPMQWYAILWAAIGILLAFI